MTAKPASRAVRFQQLCRAAAKRLHTKVSDDRVQHCATLQLARETFLARLIDGRDADPAVLLRLDESLRALMPPVEPLKVEIEYVGSLDFCPSCKGRVPDRLTAPWPLGWRPNAGPHQHHQHRANVPTLFLSRISGQRPNRTMWCR